MPDPLRPEKRRTPTRVRAGPCRVERSCGWFPFGPLPLFLDLSSRLLPATASSLRVAAHQPPAPGAMGSDADSSAPWGGRAGKRPAPSSSHARLPQDTGAWVTPYRKAVVLSGGSPTLSRVEEPPGGGSTTGLAKSLPFSGPRGLYGTLPADVDLTRLQPPGGPHPRGAAPPFAYSPRWVAGVGQARRSTLLHDPAHGQPSGCRRRPPLAAGPCTPSHRLALRAAPWPHYRRGD